MARSLPSSSWQRGFAAPLDAEPAWSDPKYFISEGGEKAHYIVPEPEEKPTTTVTNEFGYSSLRSWPSLYNGTEGQETPPSWWKPSNVVDVLICGGAYA